MGMYIGYISKVETITSIFYNFTPIAEIKGTEIISFTSEAQEVLLPKSRLHNINFSFNPGNLQERDTMQSMFLEKSLVIFEFTLEDLQENINTYTGELNKTGYKILTNENLNAKKIRFIDTEKIYRIVQEDELISDFINASIVRINTTNIQADSKVFVEYGEFLAGPYKVSYNQMDSTYYIRPQIREKKYTIHAYRKTDVLMQEISDPEGGWNDLENNWILLNLKKDMPAQQIDVISDKELLDSFQESLQHSITDGDSIHLTDIPKLLNDYEHSLLTGSMLTEDVRKNRLKRLEDIITAKTNVSQTLGVITDFVCEMLIQEQNNPSVEKWLENLLEKNPDLLEQMKSMQVISGRLEQTVQELDDLHNQYAALKTEIAEKEKEVSLPEINQDYEDLRKKVEEETAKLEVANDIQALQTKLKEEISYSERRKKELEDQKDEIKSLEKSVEKSVQELLDKNHDEMVKISFDGFMASKMLRAAAEWEAETAEKEHTELVEKVNAISVEKKTPEELIEYLCKTIQIVRPKYDKNTIINIAICMTQGFLTVFSGEPGCGKTSICNIFGEVLGLNKIADVINQKEEGKRYVSVSVEKGWTSKRDFVGYYNPLSKTFDKSNRQVYEALHQLDAEKKMGFAKFPYIILLDEANLSPMEYYWSDFMNICDDLGANSNVNLGEEYIFGIPETLHFLATINNDHTTETISPRLIDRAWIITLPQQYDISILEKKIPAEELELISWDSLREAFLPQEEREFSMQVKKIYNDILALLKEKRFIVSPRIELAIKRYWAVASKYLEMDSFGTDAEIVALDYAIAQKILPKISGTGELEEWLGRLLELFRNNGLSISARILEDILQRGNQQRMKYYQFFY